VNRKKNEPAHEIANEETIGISDADFYFYIRRATIEDCQAIVGLEQECFSVPWSEKSISNDLENNSNAYYYVAIANNTVIGYIGMWLAVDDAQITNVAVSAKHRRKGVANALIRSLCDDARLMGAVMISLEVSDVNLPAISLYENEGFEKVGLRKNYYEKIGQDAIIMLKKIEQ
jgi:ribosomal-protein-alanine N-acetyltransferase